MGKNEVVTKNMKRIMYCCQAVCMNAVSLSYALCP